MAEILQIKLSLINHLSLWCATPHRIPTFYKQSLREDTNFVNFEKYVLNNHFISKRGDCSCYKMQEQIPSGNIQFWVQLSLLFSFKWKGF